MRALATLLALLALLAAAQPTHAGFASPVRAPPLRLADGSESTSFAGPSASLSVEASGRYALLCANGTVFRADLQTRAMLSLTSAGPCLGAVFDVERSAGRLAGWAFTATSVTYIADTADANSRVLDMTQLATSVSTAGARIAAIARPPNALLVMVEHDSDWHSRHLYTLPVPASWDETTDPAPYQTLADFDPAAGSIVMPTNITALTVYTDPQGDSDKALVVLTGADGRMSLGKLTTSDPTYSLFGQWQAPWSGGFSSLRAAPRSPAVMTPYPDYPYANYLRLLVATWNPATTQAALYAGSYVDQNAYLDYNWEENTYSMPFEAVAMAYVPSVNSILALVDTHDGSAAPLTLVWQPLQTNTLTLASVAPIKGKGQQVLQLTATNAVPMDGVINVDTNGVGSAEPVVWTAGSTGAELLYTPPAASSAASSVTFNLSSTGALGFMSLFDNAAPVLFTVPLADEGAIEIVDRATAAQQTNILSSARGLVTPMMASPDAAPTEAYFISGNNRNEIYRLSLTNGSVTLVARQPSSAVLLAIATDGTYVYAASTNAVWFAQLVAGASPAVVDLQQLNSGNFGSGAELTSLTLVRVGQPATASLLVGGSVNNKAFVRSLSVGSAPSGTLAPSANLLSGELQQQLTSIPALAASNSDVYMAASTSDSALVVRCALPSALTASSLSVSAKRDIGVVDPVALSLHGRYLQLLTRPVFNDGRLSSSMQSLGASDLTLLSDPSTTLYRAVTSQGPSKRPLVLLDSPVRFALAPSSVSLRLLAPALPSDYSDSDFAAEVNTKLHPGVAGTRIRITLDAVWLDTDVTASCAGAGIPQSAPLTASATFVVGRSAHSLMVGPFTPVNGSSPLQCNVTRTQSDDPSRVLTSHHQLPVAPAPLTVSFGSGGSIIFDIAAVVAAPPSFDLFVGLPKPLTFNTPFAFGLGEALLSLECDGDITVTPASSCLSNTAHTFQLTATRLPSDLSVMPQCRTRVTGAYAVWFDQTPLTWSPRNISEPLVVQWVGAGADNSVTVHEGEEVTPLSLNISSAPAGQVRLYFTCSSEGGLAEMWAATRLSPSTLVTQVTVSGYSAGVAFCIVTFRLYSALDEQRVQAPPMFRINVLPSKRLEFHGLAPGQMGYSQLMPTAVLQQRPTGADVTRVNWTLTNPRLSGASDTLILPTLTCSASDGGVATLTISPLAGSGASMIRNNSAVMFSHVADGAAAANVLFEVEVQPLADAGKISVVTCQWGSSMGGSVGADYSLSSLPTVIVPVGRVQQVIGVMTPVGASADLPAGSSCDSQSRFDLSIGLPAGVDLGGGSRSQWFSIRCTRGSARENNIGGWSSNYFPLGATNQSVTYTWPTYLADVRQLNCHFWPSTASYPDVQWFQFEQQARQFATINKPKATLQPTFQLSSGGALPQRLDGAQATSFTVSLTSPLPAGSTRVLTAQPVCTLSPAATTAATVSVSTTGGATSSSNTVTFGSDATATATWTITLPAASASPAGWFDANCGWQLGGNAACAFDAPTVTVVNVGAVTQLTTVLPGGSNTARMGSPLQFQVSAASGTNGDFALSISADCNVCGNTGSGSVSSASLAASASLPASAPTLTFTPSSVGNVTCRFAVSGLSAAHFLAPAPVTFQVAAFRQLDVTAASGFSAVQQKISDSASLTSPLSVVASDVLTAPSLQLTIGAPQANVEVALSCDSGVTVTPSGGASVTSNRVTFQSSTSASGSFALTLPTPAPRATIAICTWSLTGANSGAFAAPPQLHLLLGARVPLTVTPPVASPIVGQPSADIAVSYDATLFTGSNKPEFTVTPQCSVAGGSVTATPASLAFSSSDSRLSFQLQSSVTGSASCSFRVAGSDAPIMTAPASFTVTPASPLQVTLSAPVVAQDGQSARITVTPPSSIPAGVSASYNVDCKRSSLSADVSYTALSVSQDVVTFSSSSAAAVTLVVQHPPVGGPASHAGETLTCSLLESAVMPVGALQLAAPSVSWSIGIAANIRVTAPTGRVYASYLDASDRLVYSTSSVVTFQADACSDGSFLLAGLVDDTTPSNGGSVALVKAAKPTASEAGVEPTQEQEQTQEEQAQAQAQAQPQALEKPRQAAAIVIIIGSGNTQMLPCTGGQLSGLSNGGWLSATGATSVLYVPPTVPGTYTCSLQLAQQRDGHFVLLNSTLTFEVLAREQLVLSGVPERVASLPSEPTVYPVTVALPTPLTSTGGVTFEVRCYSSYLSFPSSYLYFHPSSQAPQQIPLTFDPTQLRLKGMWAAQAQCQLAPYINSRTPVLDALSYGEADRYLPATFRMEWGQQETITASVRGANMCGSQAMLNLTLSRAPPAGSPMQVRAQCNGVNWNDNFRYFDSASMAFQIAATLPSRPSRLRCNFNLYQNDEALRMQYGGLMLTDGLDFTTGPLPSFTVSPPSDTLFVGGVPTGAFRVSPSGPVTEDVDVYISVSGGGVAEPSRLTFTSADSSEKTFAVRLPLIASAQDIEVKFDLSNDGALYWEVPASHRLSATPMNRISLAAHFTSTAVGAVNQELRIVPAFPAIADVTLSASCSPAGAVEPAVASVTLQQGSTLSPAFSLSLRQAGAVTCTISKSGPGAAYVDVPASVSFVISPASSDGSSSGSGSLDGSTGSSSSSSGDNGVGSTGDDCPTCAAVSAASLPSLLLYTAIALAALALKL